MRRATHELRKSSKQHLSPLLERIDGDIRYVLLGEASHGTSEFYTVRSEFSKRLIEEKGFSFIAVEGDWPDCYKLNRYVKKCLTLEPVLMIFYTLLGDGLLGCGQIRR
jgi:erythromycin esterase